MTCQFLIRLFGLPCQQHSHRNSPTMMLTQLAQWASLIYWATHFSLYGLYFELNFFSFLGKNFFYIMEYYEAFTSI